MKRLLRTLIIFLLTLTFSGALRAQTQIADSLKRMVQNHPQQDSLRAYYLMRLAEELIGTDLQEAATHAKESIVLAEKIKSPVSSMRGYFTLAKVYAETGNIDSARNYFMRSISLAQQLGNLGSETKFTTQLAVVESRIGNYETALKILQDVIPVAEKSGSTNLLAAVYGSIAGIFFEQNDYKKSLEYELKGYQLARIEEDIRIITDISNVGQSYGALANNDSALYYMHLAVEKSKFYADTIELADCYSALGDQYRETRDLDSSIYYYELALGLYNEFGYEGFLVGGTYSGAAEIYLLRKDYKSALEYYKKSEALLEPADFQDQLEYTLKGLANTYAGMGDYENAFTYALKYESLHDTLNAIAKTSATQQLERKYSIAQKEKEIELLNKEKLLQQKEVNQQRLIKNFLIAGVAVLLLIAFLLFNRYQIKQRAGKQLELQNKLIEEQKQRAEKEQLRAEKSEKFKSQFLANMSHEIRTPLNAISGFTNLLFDEESAEKKLRYLNTIKKSTDNLLVVINDVLDLSKLEAGKMQFEKAPFRLHDVLNLIYETFELKAAEKKLNWKLEVGEHVPPLLSGDASRLTQVLMNLTANAMKFTNAGTVVLNTSADPVGKTITFSVTDTGPGIPKDQLQKIFESFSQADSNKKNSGGTGLGLTISKTLVELMHGTLEVDSTEGMGSVFSFTIPYVIPTSAEWQLLQQNELVYEEDLGEELQGISILVAEDNEYNQLLIHDTLKRYIPNVTVRICKNGKEVLSALAPDTTTNDSGLTTNDFHLILMDVQMPEMDGYETTAIIRNELKNSIPIIALTASVIRSDIDKCLEAGMNSYVPKPFSAKELLKAIGLLLGKKMDGKHKENSMEEDKPVLSETILQPTEKYQWIHLDHLENLVAGDAVQVTRYLRLFYELIPARMLTLKKALETQDFTLIRKTVHVMKPQMASLGLSRAKKLAETIESNYHREERISGDVELLMNDCTAALEEVKSELKVNS
ncbi:MAG: ATP-binding protein [Chitinophagales bacterium]